MRLNKAKQVKHEASILKEIAILKGMGVKAIMTFISANDLIICGLTLHSKQALLFAV